MDAFSGYHGDPSDQPSRMRLTRNDHGLMYGLFAAIFEAFITADRMPLNAGIGVPILLVR